MASAPLVDFHCHLDLYPDLAAAIRRSEVQEVFTLAVTTTPRAWAHNEALASPTRFVRAALGLHPQLIAQHAHELTLFEALLPRTRYVGEIGLDAGPHYYRSLEQQKVVFERIIRLCAAARDKVISVHSVRATKAVLDTIEQNLPPTHGRVVLHWFTGSSAEARRAVELGCYFSINAGMLDKERHAAMVQTIPLDRILTETDGPFTRTGERPSQPVDVAIVVEALGRLRGMQAAEMADVIRGNLRALLA